MVVERAFINAQWNEKNTGYIDNGNNKFFVQRWFEAG